MASYNIYKCQELNPDRLISPDADEIIATLLLLKSILHWKLRSHWLTNANEMDTNNMKSRWPTPAPCVGDPTPPIFHLLALGVGVGGNANFSVFRYQYVGITNAKLWRWGSKPTRGPNANGFVSQWNIGLTQRSRDKRSYRYPYTCRYSVCYGLRENPFVFTTIIREL